ncbi:hypothetical protein BQ8420_24005 [Nocardiopsis sp. JB363]|nr:hypothetical protein BQ8420_24005 [Nocardiopsis sp. JB363]
MPLVVAFLGYALGKAYYASQGRLGFPGGPDVPPEAYERPVSAVLGVAAEQWLAAATGLAGALLILAAVTEAGRRVPRPLMLLLLSGALLGVGAAAVAMAADAFLGMGPGWEWYHGLLGIVALVLMVATTVSYVRSVGPWADTSETM